MKNRTKVQQLLQINKKNNNNFYIYEKLIIFAHKFKSYETKSNTLYHTG